MNYHKYSNKTNISFSYVMLSLVVVFLFIPLFVVVFFSFNSAKGMQWDHASLVWYEKLIFDSPSLWAAFKNSLIIALTSSMSATVLGSLAAIGIKWYRFHGRSYISTVSYLPMVLPEVIIGISMLIFFSAVKIRLGMFTIFVAHTTFNLPFVFMMVSARLDEFDYSTLEAARDLGANERQTLMKVIIPTIIPAILSGFLMCSPCPSKTLSSPSSCRDLVREPCRCMYIR
jgi:spermidine/putrescine transport system permease protein